MDKNRTNELLAETRENRSIGLQSKLIDLGVSEKCRAALEEEFPALKESEEERIRKDMVTYLRNELHNITQLTPRTNEVERWITYLEKQKEPQPTEWSEEDENMLNRIIRILDDLGYDEFCKSSRDQDAPEDRLYCEEIAWLKSLRPQPRWKPTKAMLDALNWACSEFHPDCIDTMDNLTYLYKEIEQLYMTGIEYMNTICPTTSAGREPNREDVADAFEDGVAEGYKHHWKPSKEQMGALRTSNSYWRGTTNETPKIRALESLYEDLKKLL